MQAAHNHSEQPRRKPEFGAPSEGGSAPLDADEASLSHEANRLWQYGGGFRRRLLVADDDASLRGGVVDLLASLQLEILEADTGPDALAIARGSRVHAALLDLHMPGHELPGLGGLEVLAALRRGGFTLPCILYSADLTPALEERIRLAGALSILHKPVDPVLLRAEVRRALASAPRDLD